MAIDAINNSSSFASYQGSSSTYTPKDTGNITGNTTQVEDIASKAQNSATSTVTKDESNESEDTFRQSTQSSEQLKKSIESLNNRLGHSEALFGIHEETNRVIIKIVDKETKEVIKELPPEKTLDMIAKAWELAGLLVDERR